MKRLNLSIPTLLGTLSLTVLTWIVITRFTWNLDFYMPDGYKSILPPLLFTQITAPWLIAVLIIYVLLLKKETSTTTAYTYLIMTTPFIFFDILFTLIQPEFFNLIDFSIGCMILLTISGMFFAAGQVVFIVKLLPIQ